jgi:hypothetical protein
MREKVFQFELIIIFHRLANTGGEDVGITYGALDGARGKIDLL